MGEAQRALIVWARPDGFDWRRRFKGEASGVWETSPGISGVRSERLRPFPSIADDDCAVGPRPGKLHDTKMCHVLIARTKEETAKSGCLRRQSRRWERKSPSSMFAQVRAQPPSEAKPKRCTYRVCRRILRYRPHLEGHDGNSTHLALQPSEVLCPPTLQCPTVALCEVARHVESNCDDIPEIRGRKFGFTVCSGMHNGGSDYSIAVCQNPLPGGSREASGLSACSDLSLDWRLSRVQPFTETCTLDMLLVSGRDQSILR
jgi:hypothetical protein